MPGKCFAKFLNDTNCVVSRGFLVILLPIQQVILERLIFIVVPCYNADGHLLDETYEDWFTIDKVYFCASKCEETAYNRKYQCKKLYIYFLRCQKLGFHMSILL